MGNANRRGRRFWRQGFEEGIDFFRMIVVALLDPAHGASFDPNEIPFQTSSTLNFGKRSDAFARRNHSNGFRCFVGGDINLDA